MTVAGAKKLGQTVEYEQLDVIIDNRVVKIDAFGSHTADNGNSKIVSTFKLGGKTYVSIKTVFPNGAITITGPDISAKGGEFHSIDYATGVDASNRSLTEVSVPWLSNSHIGVKIHFSASNMVKAVAPYAAAAAATAKAIESFMQENGGKLEEVLGPLGG